MFFNKNQKSAFLLVPKCGTHTLISFFHQPNWHYLPFGHATLEFLANKYPNLNQYKVYGFLRNPLLRFESGIRHVCRTKMIECNSYEDVVTNFEKYEKQLSILLKPQTYWLANPRVTPLDFDNLESELHRITETAFPVKQLNAAGDSWRSEITDKVRAFVREYYAADYALAKDRLGKTYED